MTPRLAHTSKDRTFYSDFRTGICHTTPTIFPTPDASSASASAEQVKRIDALQAKLDSLHFIISSQPAKLTNFNKKIDHLYQVTDIEFPNEDPVEACMKDHELKFHQAQENAREAAQERKRSIYHDTAEQIKTSPMDAFPKRKRTMSSSRDLSSITLNLETRIFINSIRIITITQVLKATEHESVRSLLAHVKTHLAQSWQSYANFETAHDAGLDFNMDTLSWTMKLEEDAHMARLTHVPTSLTSSDLRGNVADVVYRAWYWRNVISGENPKEGYDVVFRGDMKTTEAKELYKMTEKIELK